MPVEIIIGAAGASLTLLDLILKAKGKLIAPKEDPFLNYDTSYLLGVYAGEETISHYIPYKELLSFVDEQKQLEIEIKARVFKYQPPNQEWSRISDLGFSKLLESKRINNNEESIKLHNVIEDENKITLSVQRATYFDQCKSNLILDWTPCEKDRISLRSLLRGQYGNKLPELSVNSLANTIGIAALIYYKDGGEFVPYMVKRVKKVGVFPGGIHCTSSGVAKWPSDLKNKSFDTFFTNHMYSELEEEVGLSKNDIEELLPMSICREFSRGGKPQIFYVGITTLSKNELIKKRKLAQKIIKELNLWPEIEQSKWYKSEIVLSSEALLQSIKKYKVTLEGVASLHYGAKYLKKRDSSSTYQDN